MLINESKLELVGKYFITVGAPSHRKFYKNCFMTSYEEFDCMLHLNLAILAETIQFNKLEERKISL